MRRLQFSLRALLVAILATGSLVGWLAQRLAFQRETVIAIRRLGGGCGYEWPGEWGTSAVPRWVYESPLRDLILQVRVVSLREHSDQQRCLPFVSRLPYVETVVLSGKKINDESLEYLRDMPRLKTVWLLKTNVTSDGVGWLQARYPLCAIHVE